ncbi:MAG TPA: thioesterase family protein [Elusimicrobiota bacterium]|nr:thioesterase family protein [Elusimicrobiota bacterium]
MEGFRLVSEVPMRFADTDAMGHVNNARYLSFLECARIDYLRRVLGRTEPREFGVIIARTEIDYKSPAFHYETLLVGCRVDGVGESSLSMSHRVEEKSSGRLIALAKAVLVGYDYAAQKTCRISEEWREKIATFEGGMPDPT